MRKSIATTRSWLLRAVTQAASTDISTGVSVSDFFAESVAAYIRELWSCLPPSPPRRLPCSSNRCEEYDSMNEVEAFSELTLDHGPIYDTHAAPTSFLLILLTFLASESFSALVSFPKFFFELNVLPEDLLGSI